MKERVLWLIRKDSVYHSDVTELIRLGYDVYSGRKITWENRTNSYFNPLKDKEAISIDKDTLDSLMTLDFVHSLTDEQWNLVNQTFQYVFIDYIPSQFEMILKSFRGTIVFRPTELSDSSYGDLLVRNHGLAILEIINKLGKRFWFAPVFYENAKGEANILNRRLIHLPLLFGGEEDPKKNSEGAKVMVVLPEINTIKGQEQVYRNIAEQFRKNKIEYIICGKQFIDTRYNVAIHGDMSQEEFKNELANSACLYLPAKAKGDLLYYFMSAVRQNMPVIFTEESAFASFWLNFGETRRGIVKLSGNCLSDNDAMVKIRKIMHHQGELKAEILKEQKRLLDETAEQKRKERFIRSWSVIEQQQAMRVVDRSLFHVGIVLLDSYSRDLMMQVPEFVRAIRHNLEDREVKIILGYPENKEYLENREELRAIEDSGVPLRSYRCEEKDERWLRDMLSMKGYPFFSEKEPIYVLNDHGTYFEDCDVLFFVVSLHSGMRNGYQKIVTSKPYSIYLQDGLIYLQDSKKQKDKEENMEESEDSAEQRTGDSFSDSEDQKKTRINMSLLRHAQSILCQNDAIVRYVSQHLGIPDSKIQNIGTMIGQKEENQQKVTFLIDDCFLYCCDGEDENGFENIERNLFQYYTGGGKYAAGVVCFGNHGDISFVLIERDRYLDAVRYSGKSENNIRIREYLNKKGLLITNRDLESLIRDCRFAVFPTFFDFCYSMIVKLCDRRKKSICPKIFGLQNIPGADRYLISKARDFSDEIAEMMLTLDHDNQENGTLDTESVFARADLTMVCQTIRKSCLLLVEG